MDLFYKKLHKFGLTAPNHLLKLKKKLSMGFSHHEIQKKQAK